MNEELHSILSSFDSISLEEMDGVKLLNRIDTKYTFCPENINALILSLNSTYRILEIKGNRTNRYQTLYFDTPNYQLFLDHHNERVNRYKLRFRKYVDSNLSYLEMKFKTAKERTDKKRTRKEDIEMQLSDSSLKFIEKHLKRAAPDFVPVLWNSFMRLTFVHKLFPERLTIDIGLEFSSCKTGEIVPLPTLVVAEVKRDKATAHSDFVQMMKKEGVREVGFSKYCIGALLLNKKLKYNRFKAQLLKLNKLTHGNIQPLAAY